MRKAASFSRWSLLMGVACGLAMLPVANRVASAETITMSMSVNGGAYFSIDAFATITPPPPGPPTYTITNIAGLDTILASLGSAYHFVSLSGESTTWPGSFSSAGGTLSLGGEIFTTGPAVGQTVSIKETLTGYTSPSGLPGTLSSASTATFNNAGPGNSHSASSIFTNSLAVPIPTLTYPVASTTTGPDNEGNSPPSVPIPLGSFTTPYSLTNVITFTLPSSGADDAFGVTAKVTAVPEPASVVTMLIGLPMPLVGLAWLRRRKAGIANS